MAPKHYDVNVGNYKESANTFIFKGYNYYVSLLQADIYYFNGGDQSYHIRCWLNDDGIPNPIFS